MLRTKPVLRKFGVRLWVLTGCLLVLTILGGYLFANVLDQARIGSQRYQAIIDIKELQAEAHAPSLRLADTQLAVQQLALAAEPASDSDIAALAELEADYREGFELWKATVADPGTETVLVSSNREANDYFDEVNGPFTAAAISGNVPEMTALLDGSVTEKYLQHEEAVDEVARLAATDLAAAEKAARQTLQSDKNILLLIVLGLGLVGILLTALTLRSLTSRLRAMRESASKEFPRLIAQAELAADPEVEVPTYAAPEIRGRDEMARTERAFHRVLATGIQLAADQARLRQMTSDMLTYIGRRNHQQLSVGLTSVADLEGVPLGPERTAEMTRLQALMTHMRRDAEGILVLAGAPAMRSWSEPVSMVEALEVGLSEVESLARIRADVDGSIQMHGAAASDLAHMVAELVDNALTFTDPESLVTIVGRPEQGGYELLVSDDGLGIEPQLLAQLNGVLTNGELDLHDSRRLGLSVVARLAFRNDIDVSLSHKPTGGLIARVLVPETCLIADDGPTEPEAGLTIAPSVEPADAPTAATMDKPEALPRRIRGASLHDSLRGEHTSTVVIPELRSAESVRTTLSSLAMGQLAASEHHEADGAQT